MRLRRVSFDNWLRSHTHKEREERWLRELYPWPVLAQVHCDQEHLGVPQSIRHDGAAYEVTLRRIEWQCSHQTYRYRMFVESEGLAWHSRPFSDEYDMCGTRDGRFKTLFHRKKKEPLERIARAFFSRRWSDLSRHDFRSLAVSRYLAASVVCQVAERAYGHVVLTDYPTARVAGGYSPMLAHGSALWLGYRFYSEDAYAWARNCAGEASEVVAFYFADTRYQFRTDLPPGSSVRPVSEVDSEVGGEHRDLILALMRQLELPPEDTPLSSLEEMVRGRSTVSAVHVSESDVNEAHAALRRPCESKAELRYQLAAGVLLNAWIENERARGFPQRKKFYAFKQRIGELFGWAGARELPGVALWVEEDARSSHPLAFLRIDGVDFSFHAVPGVQDRRFADRERLTWSGVRLKPIAPLVLRWARFLMEAEAPG